MKRRDVILGIAGVAVAGGGVALLLRGGPVLHAGPCGDRTLTLRTDDLGLDPRSMRRVGRAVLAAEGSPATETLAARIFDADTWEAACRRGARSALAGRIDADLAAGRIVTVRGWVLARTEADLCALVAKVDPA